MPNINELDKLPPGPIEPGNLELVQKVPFKLLDKFEWCEIDLKDDE